jgi:hypothetical protein
MSAGDAKKTAQQYLQDQAKIMQKYGSSPKLSGAKYQEAVSETQKTFQMLSKSKNK